MAGCQVNPDLSREKYRWLTTNSVKCGAPVESADSPVLAVPVPSLTALELKYVTRARDRVDSVCTPDGSPRHPGASPRDPDRVRAYPERANGLLIRPVWTAGIHSQQYARSPDLPGTCTTFETNRFSPSRSSLA